MNFFASIPKTEELEQDPKIIKALIPAHRYLAELKGLAHSIPNDQILLFNTRLREAKDSSAIENILTTQDSLYEYQIQASNENPANKEVYSYVKALDYGYKKVQSDKGISINNILGIQKRIEPKRPGFRKLPGTVIKNMRTNKVVYTPPSPEKVPQLMSQLEDFINSNSIDPLIKMAIIHHQFESIHPFYDGNGRTGRILNILFLVLEGLLASPILYLSQYIHKHRAEYYKHLQKVRDQNTWTQWVVYMLNGVAVVSKDSLSLIQNMDKLFKEYKNRIRRKHKFYSHELINNIFTYPYTKVAFLEKDMKVSKASAGRYLDALSEDGLLEKHKLGKENYYINRKLFNLLDD